MRAYVIKTKTGYVGEDGGEFSKLNKATLFSTKKAASFASLEREKIVPINITLVKKGK